MLDGAEIGEALVKAWRGVPELVAALSGDPARIFRYEESYPGERSILAALLAMEPGQILLEWRGVSLVRMRTGGECYSHQFVAYVRAGVPGIVDPVSYSTLYKLMVDGVPAGSEVKVANANVHPQCQPPGPMTPATKQMLVVSPEGATIDYLQVPVAFLEIGDN